MMTGIHHDKSMEKQMGCMTGFFHIFDRNQIINGKRIYTAKRLPPYTEMDYSSQSESSISSPAFSGEIKLQQNQKMRQYQSQPRSSLDFIRDLRSPAPEISKKMAVPLPVFEFKEGLKSSWKFREAPRLSLDSRATVDGKGSFYPKEIRTNSSIYCTSHQSEEENDKQRRSPSVIARLMGLDALPDSGREPIKKAELRRSASESRVSRDLRSIDGNNFPVILKKENNVASAADQRMRPPRARTSNLESSQKVSNGYSDAWQRKSYFDSQDFFPEPKQSGSLYGEIEKRLRMRGIDEPAKDLETLKQILEALQLKGLLHSKKSADNIISSRNIVYDGKFAYEEAPIVLMKPSRPRVSVNRIDSLSSKVKPKQGINRNTNFSGRLNIDRNARSARLVEQNQSSEKSPSSLARRRGSPNVEVQRRGNESKSSPIHSPKVNSKKIGPDQMTIKSPRNRKPVGDHLSKERLSSPVDNEPSTISESSRSSSSQIDLERTKVEDYKEGRSLLERCDKLLHSISEITAPTNELQPSPVSVLDSSFYKDESPSPIMKRCIDFNKDQAVELEDENWSPAMSPIQLKLKYNSNDLDFVYVSEILKASTCVSEDTNVFWLLEKQQYRTNSSDNSRLHRKLVFDIITEILNRKTLLPPWKTFSSTKCISGTSHLQQIWSEFRRIREKDPAEDLFEIICGVLKKDMAGDSTNGWGDTPMETSEAVLDIERLIFKDLVVEAIQDLATFSGIYRAPLLRRKLVF
ncbi:hypothetical protein IFM89_002322 [Coptis chinensis]|uniref:DUF4378 domain-containing protein n=1 Tax=Coptis chinensis TaxID=261450 RepID=A0A835ILF1_9MAGN|nr:hypothetical protein IFM89_002322 [Coptis chinensis]